MPAAMYDSAIPVPVLCPERTKPMPTTQNLKNHARFDPVYHFFLAPLLLLNIVFSIWHTIKHWPEFSHLHLWWIVMSVALLVLGTKARSYPLAAQDRVIRLEERLRLAALLPPAEFSRCAALTEAQLIALRFASDAELPALVDRTLKENLSRKQIKEAIADWRGDHFRI
jgi:hypothetical protein